MNFQAPLTETEEKYKLVIASCTQLKKEMAGLMSEVNTVHDLVEELKKERLKKQLQNEELVMVSKTVAALCSSFKNGEQMWYFVDV